MEEQPDEVAAKSIADKSILIDFKTRPFFC
jgi:hypothetical protein